MKYFYYFLAVAFVYSACKGDGGNPITETDDSTKPLEKVEAVSFHPEVAVQAEPRYKSKYLPSLNLGEKMMYLGEEKADTANPSKKYYKVELSDGTVAWARTYGVIIDGQPATIIDETPIYKRPDLVNKTSKVFNPIEFVVIVGEKSDWVEVVGVKKTKSGWIKKQYLTTKEEDVAVSTLAHKSILGKNGELKIENVPEFLEELPFKKSVFVDYLQKKVDEQLSAAIQETVEDYAADEMDEPESEELP